VMFYTSGFCCINLLEIRMFMLKFMYSSAFEYRCREINTHLGIHKIFTSMCFEEKLFLPLLTKESVFYYERKYFNS
jgi:hypothetical protein